MENALKELARLNKDYPQLNREVADTLARCEAERENTPVFNWPSWCFLPMAGWYVLALDRYGKPQLALDEVADVIRLAAIGTWKYSQDVYTFDPDLVRELTDTDLSGDLPCDVLKRLPNFSLYIAQPFSTKLGNACGFWVHLEYDVNTQREELRFLVLTEEHLAPVILHLGNWNLAEAVARAGETGWNQSEIEGVMPRVKNEMSKREWIQTLRDTWHEPLKIMLPLVLYLCSDEPDVIGRVPGKTPVRPRPKTLKGRFRMFPPDTPTVFEVGSNIGPQLRAAREAVSRAGTGTHKRPHIRRGHWHGYWYGARNTAQSFKYRWLSPIFVGANVADEEDENA